MKCVFFSVLLSLLFALPAWAIPTQTITVNGQTYHGYWTNANGRQAFIICDPANGQPVRDVNGGRKAWVNRGQTGETIPGQQKQLYSSESWFGPEWKGVVHLPPLDPNEPAPPPKKVTTPYGHNLPDYWRWMIFKYENPNPWPVKARIRAPLGEGGETYEAQKYFGANETKYLRLKLNESISNNGRIETDNTLMTWGNVAQNFDREAPVRPVNYAFDPPADDGTGVNWAAHFSQGISVSPFQQKDYFARGVWGLVPCFKEIPVWTPEPGGDDHWGTLSFDVVPAWRWTTVANYNVVDDKSLTVELPNSPRVVLGGLGDLTTQKPEGPHGGPYIKYSVTPYRTDPGTTGTVNVTPNNLSAWWTFARDRWPSKNDIINNDSGGTYNQPHGFFYTDSTKKTIIRWGVNPGGTSLYWGALTAEQPRNDITAFENKSPIGEWLTDYDWERIPGDGLARFYQTNNPDIPCILVSKDSNAYYAPITGSYVEVKDIEYSQSSHGQIPVRTRLKYHVYIQNPCSYPVDFTLDGAHWRSANNPFTLPAAEQGKVTIPANEKVCFTAEYDLPGSEYNNYLPPEWQAENGQVLTPFAKGSISPIRDWYQWAFRVDNYKINAVGYDEGFVRAFQESLAVNKINGQPISPKIEGFKLEHEIAMTPEELTIFLGQLDGQAREKAVEIITSPAHITTWKLEQKYHSGSSGGGRSVWSALRLIA